MVLDSNKTDSAKPSNNVPQKSFFNKPKWAAPAESLTRKDFYSRADQTYIDIISAKPKQRQKHRERRKESEEEEEEEEDTRRESRDSKRRRISGSEEDEPVTRHPGDSTRDATSPVALEEESPADEPRKEEEECVQVVSPVPVREEPSPTPEKAITRATTRQHKSPDNAAVIDLEGEETEPRASTAPSPRKEEPQSELDDDSLEEEEFPELARRARERAQQNLLRGPSLSHDVGRDSEGPAASRDTSVVPAPGMGDGDIPHKEPVVQILITSNLRNTKPLIVQRKLSQRLRDVRIAWCRRQGFSEEMTATVFLTWKGTRLFDVTTCKSLGVQKEDSDPFLMGDDMSNEDGEEIHVHMEAVTEELLEAQKKQEREESTEPGENAPAAEDDGETQQQQRVRLTLNSPGIDEFKLIVKSTTRISRIISTFRKARKIPPDREVNLLFDGERLDPGTFVKDNDIDDLDAIDVQIK